LPEIKMSDYFPDSPTTSIPTTFPAAEYEADPRELEAFAERYKFRLDSRT